MTPYEFLGVEPDCSLDEAKRAFKAKVKLYHPDVYRGEEDSTALTSRLLLAYELVKDELVGGEGVDALADAYGASGGFVEADTNPFGDPKGPPDRVFVNELSCIGAGCFSCCVDKMPGLFNFAVDTQRARCTTEASVSNPEWEYPLYLAVAQCPRNCIHYVTAGQLRELKAELTSAVDGVASPDEVAARLYELLAKADYENGRERSKKRTSRSAPDPKRSTKWVDWY